MIPWWYSPCQREQSKLSHCVQREGILRGCFGSVWKCDMMQRIKTWAWLSWMLGRVQSIPAIILFGSGSQPNSELQVNNNVWICRNQVQSLWEQSKLGLATCLCLGLWPKFSNIQPRVTARVPLIFLSCAENATLSVEGRKIQLMYVKQTEDGEGLPLL